jgi:hypothetical protein
VGKTLLGSFLPHWQIHEYQGDKILGNHCIYRSKFRAGTFAGKVLPVFLEETYVYARQRP